MKLILDDEQKMLDEAARGFVTRHAPVGRLRELADDGPRYSSDLWSKCAEMGWTGIPFPESMGGLGLGFADLAVVMERLGAQLAPEPFLSTVWLAGQALILSGDEDAIEQWIPRVVAGDCVLALAYQEANARFNPTWIETRASQCEGEWTLTGNKIQVLDGAGADAFIVAARSDGEPNEFGGISLFLVSPDADGVSVVRQHRVDGRNVALLELHAAPATLIGEEGGGGAVLTGAIETATVGICAEMLGAMQSAFDMTLAYLKERKQFGVPIGSFQALKHRAAYLFSDLQIARSVVMAAARALDQHGPQHFMTCGAASLAKATCSDAFIKIACEGIQMHGGIGMTEEHDIGFYLKRARVAELTFGDSAYHRNRWARLNGY